ncbi:GNAT family N-acetyltransferase [Salinithrix halophila]|uniref:GNAT family N-acetyltransferase n=1 Tax=Salinithrix halophila TaxID=1485204 RepID=A0ABV8JI29_9BACL
MTLTAGEDLCLILFKQEHARPLFRLLEENRPLLERWLDWMVKIRTSEQMEAYILRSLAAFASGSQAHFGIWSSGVLAGSVTVERFDSHTRTAEIGYWLGECHSGRGLMTRAVLCTANWLFQERGANRIEIRCEADNRPSQAVALRAGFTWEGTLREAGFRQGQFVDHLIYSLLHKEWEETIPSTVNRKS